MKTAALFCLNILLTFSSSAYALVILQYHHVSDDMPDITSVSPKLFASHLAYLDKNNFNVVPLTALRPWFNGHKTFPDKTVAITFDDGYRSIYDEAYPLLKARGWPFTVFINTQPHDEAQASHMTWDELREITHHGGVVANHGKEHPHLVRRKNDVSGVKIFHDEITYAEKRIKKEIGHSYALFAYPYGEYDEAITNVLAQKGYLAFAQHSGAVPKDVNQQVIPRFPFGGQYGAMDDFMTKVNSLAVIGLNSTVHDVGGAVILSPELPQGTTRPILELTLPDEFSTLTFNCFASRQGAAHVKRKHTVVSVQAKRELSVGRSRYNCTAPARQGRFYWYSKMFLRKAEDGTWQHE